MFDCGLIPFGLGVFGALLIGLGLISLLIGGIAGAVNKVRGGQGGTALKLILFGAIMVATAAFAGGQLIEACQWAQGGGEPHFKLVIHYLDNTTTTIPSAPQLIVTDQSGKKISYIEWIAEVPLTSTAKEAKFWMWYNRPVEQLGSLAWEKTVSFKLGLTKKAVYVMDESELKHMVKDKILSYWFEGLSQWMGQNVTATFNVGVDLNDDLGKKEYKNAITLVISPKEDLSDLNIAIVAFDVNYYTEAMVPIPAQMAGHEEETVYLTPFGLLTVASFILSAVGVLISLGVISGRRRRRR